MITRTDTDSYAGPHCQICGGPCWRWKGSVWEYTCTACLNAYLDAAAAKAEAKHSKARERLVRKVFTHIGTANKDAGTATARLCSASSTRHRTDLTGKR